MTNWQIHQITPQARAKARTELIPLKAASYIYDSYQSSDNYRRPVKRCSVCRVYLIQLSGSFSIQNAGAAKARCGSVDRIVIEHNRTSLVRQHLKGLPVRSVGLTLDKIAKACCSGESPDQHAAEAAFGQLQPPSREMWKAGSKLEADWAAHRSAFKWQRWQMTLAGENLQRYTRSEFAAESTRCFVSHTRAIPTSIPFFHPDTVRDLFEQKRTKGTKKTNRRRRPDQTMFRADQEISPVQFLRGLL